MDFEANRHEKIGGLVPDEFVRSAGSIPRGFQFSPDRSKLVASSGSSLLVWDQPDGAGRPDLIRAGRQQLTDIAFHPSGRYLAATSNDTTVKLYDTSTWQLARTYSWSIGRLRSIAFSPDGTLAAAGSDTGRIVVWDVDD